MARARQGRRSVRFAILVEGNDASHDIEPDRSEHRRGFPPRTGLAGRVHRRDPRVRRADTARVLDVLLSANLTVAVVVLLTTLAIHTPQEFSAFPTILLTTTLTRLVLNVATARLVLTRGGIDGLEAAGDVIRAFGTFVAGDQVIVGVILFSILVVIQFVVITQGATRISEVAARFTLDGLPGRQMAIDADLHAGLIDQHEAHRRRDEVYRQADFFGAMDGASRFIRGDAIAGVVILLVNIGGGLLLGMINHGMSLGEAVNVFTKLTIGDGLVSQVPAFLTSLAAGLIVTRSSSSTDLSRDVVGQLFSHPGVLGTAAAFLGLMALTPLPKIPLLTLAACHGRRGVHPQLSARGRGERWPASSDREAGAGSCSFPDPIGGSIRIRRRRLGQIDGLVVVRGSRPDGGIGRPGFGTDGRPAPCRPARARDRFPADRPGRPDARRRSARPAQDSAATRGSRAGPDRAAGADSR